MPPLILFFKDSQHKHNTNRWLAASVSRYLSFGSTAHGRN